jgi:thioredoxin 1
MCAYEAVHGEGPTREEIDRSTGRVLLEFGTGWCPHCQGAQPTVKSLLDAHPGVAHIKVEDGRGRPLGRSFAVKLWPNFVFLRDGKVAAQLARPSTAELRDTFEQFAK